MPSGVQHSGTRPCPLALVLAALLAALPARAQLAGIRRSPEARVNALFAEFSRPDAPGCAIAITRNGRLEYAQGYGLADLDTRRPLTAATPIPVASVSKQFTAAAVLLLADAGTISLDGAIRGYVPELPEVTAPITVRHLLHHTSGLRDYLGLLTLRGWRFGDTLSPRGLLDVLARQAALNFAPGTRYLYGNTGYALLAILVERATGQGFADAVGGRLFGPVGMTHSSFHRDARGLAATGYEPSGATFRVAVPRLDVVGDGGLVTTAEDLSRWEMNFVAPRGTTRPVMRRLGERGVLADGDTIPYAMGLEHGIYRGLPTLAHSGAYEGYRADMTRFPDHQLGIAVLCNRSDANATLLSRGIADIWLEREFRDHRVPSANLKATSWRPDLPGDYWNDTTETLTRITVSGGHLAAVTASGTADLAPVGPDTFLVAATGTRYAFAGTSLTVHRPFWPPESSQRVDSAVSTPEELSAIPGTYASTEVGGRLVVGRAGGRLLLHLGSEVPSALTPAFGRTFLGPGGLVVRFAADGNAFTISNGRTQRVRFERQVGTTPPGARR